ncbi:TPA: type II toxin-antitoxin system RelE/ParE family toxin [Stenotrophomonas maltophilia]
MRQGLIDADIGGGLLKKRVALPGRGKRGSARVIVATKVGRYWFFLLLREERARDHQ